MFIALFQTCEQTPEKGPHGKLLRLRGEGDPPRVPCAYCLPGEGEGKGYKPFVNWSYSDDWLSSYLPQTQRKSLHHGFTVCTVFPKSLFALIHSNFAKLKQLLDTHSGKLELVCVNLDNTLDEARKYLSSSPAPGNHLHQDSGLESKMATEYGIQVLPTILLVGKDGKVTSRNGQIANLEEEVKKLVK